MPLGTSIDGRNLSSRVVGRLGLYRRELENLRHDGVTHVHSAELAASTASSAALVRRDLMTIGHKGSPVRGYDVKALAGAIDERLEPAHRQPVVLVGVGHLGRVVLQDVPRQLPVLRLAAAFDRDPSLVGRRICGVPVLDVNDLESFVIEHDVTAAVVAVPGRVAQRMADRLVAAGVTGLLNLTHTRLRTPSGVYVEDTDIGLSLERVAYFGHREKGDVA